MKRCNLLANQKVRFRKLVWILWMGDALFFLTIINFVYILAGSAFKAIARHHKIVPTADRPGAISALSFIDLRRRQALV